MTRYYDAARQRLIYVGQEATAAYWDAHWLSDDAAQAALRGDDSLVVPETRRRLAPGSRVLEAGCGTARYVYALHRQGYRASGLDFARQTLRVVRRQVGELPLVVGDVFRLPVASQAVDGLWSLGVIEHFWNGYQPILDEAARVLRPGGYHFLCFPALTWLRRRRAARGAYPIWDAPAAPPGFYQFALSPRLVQHDVEASGFRLLHQRNLFGDLGLREEWPAAGRRIGALVAPPPRLARRAAAALLNRLTVRACGHSVLQIYERLPA
ncbi:MAG: class I SAM-dependent methyltransferase [Fimbriimonadaceae bacterium]|nr:class I SAM-dependent methyltransferase [Fimbriimonadaceae bacterium]